MRPIIGLVGPASLAEALVERGAQVVTAEVPRDAARLIRECEDLSGVLVSGPPDTGLVAWAKALGLRTRVVAVGDGWPCRALGAPVSVESLCAALRLEPLAGDGDRLVAADGSVSGLEGASVLGAGSAGESAPEVVEQDGASAVRARRVPSWARSEVAEGGARTAPPRPWDKVVFVASGRGGAGRTHLAVHLAAVACERGLDAVVVDANVGPGGLAQLLRVGGVSTVADLVAGAEVGQVVVGPDEVRAAGGVRVPFASVLSPDADQVMDLGSWPAVYERAIAHLVERASLVVVDTSVWWSPSCPGSWLIETGLGHGAALLVVADASREGLSGARRLAAWARARTRHVMGVYNALPSRRLPSLDEAGRGLDPASVCGVLPYDETVRLRAARGEVIHPLLGLGASQVLDALGLGAA